MRKEDEDNNDCRRNCRCLTFADMGRFRALISNDTGYSKGIDVVKARSGAR